MKSHSTLNSRRLRPVALAAIALAAQLAAGANPAWAGNNFRQAAVGGVSIDPTGVLREADPAARKLLFADLERNVARPSDDMALPVGLRMISLKGIEAACADGIASNVKIADEVKYLGGLQRIQYVFVYPERNDVVLAGPGEGWRVDERANVVGLTTGRPVLQLDDLLVALRQARAARGEQISCSIDPTEEGYRQLNELLGGLKGAASRIDPAAMEDQMKTAFGPQQITVTGVPATSHFARVMVAADYKMKRIAMNLDASPVKGLSGYLDMVKSGGAATNPRWWLTCNYEPMGKSEDGLAWELRGPGVKALTEDESVGQDGKVRGTGKASIAASRWADNFSKKYDELSAKEPIFGELRNIMDLCVVAAVIDKEDLFAVAGANLPLLTGEASEVAIETWSAPKTVAPQVSFLRTGKGYVVSASGGVQVASYDVISKTEVSPAVAETRTKAAPAGKSWWWN